MTSKEEANRKRNLKTRFNITIDEYDHMFNAQDGKCYICKRKPRPNRRLSVDHNHSNGDIRGLLCTPCNRELRYWDLYPERLPEAYKYLMKDPFYPHRVPLGGRKKKTVKRRRRAKRTTVVH